MFKYYISIILLGIFVVILIVGGIIVAGNPISQKDLQLDEIRIQAFNDIKYQIENYYKANRKLPSSLIEIKSLNIKDPETKDNYDYKTQLPYDYQLCATFSTDNSEIIDRTGYANYESNSAAYKKHKKGYDCLSFGLSDYVLNSAKPSVLNVNSYPQGVTMSSSVVSYGGTTYYTKTSNSPIETRIDAPRSVVIGGTTYTFNSWSGCNNDTVSDQYCTVSVNGNTVVIIATYIVSSPSPSISQ